MITLDFDLLMEDCYYIEPDLLMTIKTYLECGVTLKMDYIGNVWLTDVPQYFGLVGTILFYE